MFAACAEKDQSSRGSPTPLRGPTWVSKGTVSGYAATDTVIFGEDLSYTDTIQVFADSSGVQKMFSMTITGTYTLPQSETTTDGEKGQIDMNNLTATAKPDSATTASGWNSSAYCGITNWVQGQSQSIIGRNCGGSTISANAMQYNIYSSSWGQLSFGERDATHDGRSSSARPVTLSTDTLYYPN
jgi:hypothetical protein